MDIASGYRNSYYKVLIVTIIKLLGEIIMNPMSNIKLLKEDMESKGWIIESFNFSFKNYEYIVLVVLYNKDEKKPKFASVRMIFHKQNFSQDTLTCPANSNGLMLSAKELREFFGISYSENLGDILLQFAKHLGNFIPCNVKSIHSEQEKRLMVSQLSMLDKEDEAKVYCYAVKRNPLKISLYSGESKQCLRSKYNDNKTRLLRHTLYEKLGSDKTISFCYSADSSLDYSDIVIIDNWNKNKAKYI